MLLFIRLRSLILVLLYPIYLVVLSGISVVLNILFNNRKIDNFIVKVWASGTCRMFGVRVKVNGAERVQWAESRVANAIASWESAKKAYDDAKANPQLD